MLAAAIAAAGLLSGCGSSSPAAKHTAAAKPSTAAAPTPAQASSAPAAKPTSVAVAGPKLAAKVKKQLASQGMPMRSVTCPRAKAKAGASVSCRYDAAVEHGRLKVTFTAVHGSSYAIETFVMTVHKR